jgi:hypothetical protein
MKKIKFAIVVIVGLGCWGMAHLSEAISYPIPEKFSPFISTTSGDFAIQSVVEQKNALLPPIPMQPDGTEFDVDKAIEALGSIDNPRVQIQAAIDLSTYLNTGTNILSDEAVKITEALKTHLPYIFNLKEMVTVQLLKVN